VIGKIQNSIKPPFKKARKEIGLNYPRLKEAQSGLPVVVGS
jgi:hypothetical protein